MAGSPGAGKTEFSERYITPVLKQIGNDITKGLGQKDIGAPSAKTLLIRIDADEIRCFLPQYKKTNVETQTKGNAHVVQRAVNRGLDILRDYCLTNDISFIHDGTFGNYSTMEKIIKRSIKIDRSIYIYYLYLDPLAAWENTKAREYIDGRNILKTKFIEQYFKSQENVERIKQNFGNSVNIHCILKNSSNKVIDIKFNQPGVELYLQSQYKNGVIKRYSQEDLMDLLN
ncbi:MAG TPA: hypothetical protein ENI57_01820 [Ignavibacteria bacterium]|nr:hypothetical protein [Ignavibacteria bacterium]